MTTPETEPTEAEVEAARVWLDGNAPFPQWPTPRQVARYARAARERALRPVSEGEARAGAVALAEARNLPGDRAAWTNEQFARIGAETLLASRLKETP